MNTANLRILQVIPELGKGGAEHIVIDICNELIKRGADVQLLNFRPENHYAYLTDKIERKVAPAVFVPSITGRPQVHLDAYREAVKQFKPDVIHSHLFESEMVTRQVIFPGVKYVTHLHGRMEQFKNFSFSTIFNKSSITNYLEKRLLIRQYRKCSNNFIAISRYMEDLCRERLPEDLKRIQIINNSIKYESYFKAEKNNMNRHAVKLVSIGNLGANKNHVFLIKALHQLHQQGFPAFLTIIGKGPCLQQIEEATRNAGLQQYVTMAGDIKYVKEYLHNADIYVHSAIDEGFGLVIAEAMAAGLPCVMLDAMGNRDLAEEGKNSFLIRQGDVNGFAEAVKKLIEDPALYSGMSEYAKEYAKRFDIAPYTDKLLQFYEQCAVSPS